MAINFPDSPSNNDVYTVGNRSWVYNSSNSTWTLQSASLLGANTVTTNEITDGTILNADISNSAAINTTKITNWEDDQVVLSSQVFDS
jgi:hypothetical protein